MPYLNDNGQLDQYFRFDFDQKATDIQQSLIAISDIDKDAIPYPALKVRKYSKVFTTSQDASRFSKSKKTLGIITIKNESRMLKYTLKNLKENGFYDYSDLLIVDDRSSENIKKIALDNNCMYIRVDYDDIFNFSMVNNIGAKYALDSGYEEIIFWNSDLWITSPENLEVFFETHRSHKSTITGAMLVYPPKSKSFSKLSHDKRDTIQYGGCVFDFQKDLGCFLVRHSGRHLKIDSSLHNQNHHVAFVTGALILTKADLFYKLGGFNPSLKVNFQDLDFCLRGCELNHVPYYVGKDCYFYHDEGIALGSPSFSKLKADDMLLYSKIWHASRFINILGAV